MFGTLLWLVQDLLFLAGWYVDGLQILPFVLLVLLMVPLIPPDKLFRNTPMLGFLYVLCLFFFLWCLFLRQTRKYIPAILGAGVGLFASEFTGMTLSTPVRMYAFHVASRRAQPLVEALHRHEREKGEPAVGLSDVIPRYLPKMPRGLPPLELITSDRARKEFCDNTWVLHAPVSRGPVNWDLFLYFPNRRYPKSGYGGVLQHIGDWAYVHE